ncbi:glycosylhydrolase-like jelly roll fold domain-containing protein, partial [Paenibacillus sp. YIM B09110]|uniref:glycosylhydrolase-like jelly roll fold domain-containing protein n=1 Tax=Paenibacillus sp. YIM B09110 TaxID=3126102 RepID=UPI00301CB2DC
SAAEAADQGGSLTQLSLSGGIAYTLHSYEEAEEAINQAFPRDFACLMEEDESPVPYVMHRRIGFRDIYAVYGGSSGIECFFRCHGAIELWNPWDGSASSLQAERVTAEGTYIKLPLGRTEIQLIVFADDKRVQASERKHSEQGGIRSRAVLQSLSMDGKWAFELRPTMDNRFGDFRQPPEERVIGAEARQFRFAYEMGSGSPHENERHQPEFDDSSWEKATCGYGPFMWQLGPLPVAACSDELESRLVHMTKAPGEHLVEASGKVYEWNSYAYSTRYGIEGDPGHQGYHGLKGEITDHFIAIGRSRFDLTGTRYEIEEGSLTYMWTSFYGDGRTGVRMRAGGVTPEKIWLNGELIEGAQEQLKVKEGVNTVLLRYGRAGRGDVVFERADAPGDWKQELPLAMSWHNNPAVLAYDAYPGASKPAAGWYRFTAPPGLEAMQIVSAHGDIRVWVNGKEWSVDRDPAQVGGCCSFRASSTVKENGVSLVAVRIGYDNPYYGGAALPEPIRLQCGAGFIELGDWSAIDGLTCYSGGAVYRRDIEWPTGDELQGSMAMIDLGAVSSTAEIRVNGQHVRTIVQAPWTANIAPWLNLGVNTLEVLVYNTLANHYVTIPTRYRGDLTSGLLGPVRLDILGKL